MAPDSKLAENKSSELSPVVLDVKFINPFILATQNVLSTMCNVDSELQKPLRALGDMPVGDLAGLLPMKSDKITGEFILSFPESTILAVCEKLVGESYNSICPDVVDAVGELTNMIVGGAKSSMCEEHDFSMDIPSMYIKTNYNTIPLKAPIQITIPFESALGRLYIEVGFQSLKG